MGAILGIAILGPLKGGYSPRLSSLRLPLCRHATPRKEPSEAPRTPWRSLDTPGAPWNGLEAPENPYGLQYILWFHVLGTRNWDLRWIMTRALLRETRSFSYRSVARPQYTFRLLVKCLWTPEGFQAPNAIH